MKSKVYFTKTITPEKVIEMYKVLGIDLKGNVAVKVHSGEDGNQNYLRPEFLKPMIEYVNGTVVETNTAYEGERNENHKHKELFKKHGWTKYFNVDLLDEDGDLEIEVPNGKILKNNLVGKHMEKYDSMLVLSHFKGHPMGGYGGALKQLSIGCASSAGKCMIHSAGYTKDQKILWQHIPADNNIFCECMADAASSVVNYFKDRLAYVNIMCNLSVDCDCCAIAEDPCMKDIGILSSLDPVALDQACIDLVYNSNDPGKEHFIERVESRKGRHTIDSADGNIGTKEYELIEIK